MSILALLALLLVPAIPAEAQATPDNRLEVALRGTDGQGIAGVTVTLAPRPAELGGPTSQQARVAVTDARGWVAFDDVSGGIWLLSFAGSAAGFPLQATADQGRPPYGTAPDGGGFSVAVGDSGDDIGTEDKGLGSDQSRVAQALFVGRAQGGVWVPEYDLSDPSQTPQPLSLAPTPETLAAVPTLDVSGAGATVTAAPGAPMIATASAAWVAATDTPVAVAVAVAENAGAPLEVTPLLLCYAPGLLLGLGLLGWAWLVRRHTQEERG